MRNYWMTKSVILDHITVNLFSDDVMNICVYGNRACFCVQYIELLVKLPEALSFISDPGFSYLFSFQPAPSFSSREMRLSWLMIVVFIISCDALKKRKKFEGDFEFDDESVCFLCVFYYLLVKTVFEDELNLIDQFKLIHQC